MEGFVSQRPPIVARLTAAMAIAMALATGIALPAAAQRATVRDSGGITIVENSRAAVPRTAFTLSATPTVQVTGRNDVLEYLFSPNVSAVARLSDGRIVVGDQWSFNVRVFDTKGKHQRTFGSMGSGPGQLAPITRIFILAADTIAVVDGRINLFTPEGKFIRVESMGFKGMTPISLLTDGDWVTRRGTGRDSVRVFRVARTAKGASAADTGVRLAVYDPRDPTLQGGAYVLSTMGATPFLPSVSIAGLPNGFVLGDGKTFEILEYAANGRLRRIIRRDVDLTLTDAIKARYREAELAGKWGQAKDATEQRLRTAAYPRTIPGFQRLLTDPTGRIWAQHQLIAPQIPLQWSVFDPAGKMLGVVAVPVGFRVFEVGSDYILGRLRDAKGQAHIQLYTLVPVG